MSRWTDALAALLGAVQTASGLPAGSVLWDGSAPSGAYRAEPRVDLTVISVVETGLPFATEAYDADSGTMLTTSWGLRRITLQVKITSDRASESTAPVSEIAARIGRRLRLGLDVKAALKAAGLSLETAGGTSDLSGLAWDARDYLCQSTDFVFLFVDEETDATAGDPGYFTTVHVTGTLTAPSTTITEIVGPAPIP